MKLDGKKIAVLATNGFEQSELEEPIKAIKDAGGEAEIISMKSGSIKAWKDGNWSKEVKVDVTLSDASPEDYDGLLLPGGVINPDKLRDSKDAVEFVKGFFSDKKQKPVAAICHGPWTLINADVVKGRKMTSYSSIKQDLINAGADWVDEEVVVDKGLVTSRSPDDLPVFCNKMIEEFSEGRHTIPNREAKQEMRSELR